MPQKNQNYKHYDRSGKRVQVYVDNCYSALAAAMGKDYTNFSGNGLGPFIRERIINPYLELKDLGIDINLLLEVAKEDKHIKSIMKMASDIQDEAKIKSLVRGD